VPSVISEFVFLIFERVIKPAAPFTHRYTPRTSTYRFPNTWMKSSRSKDTAKKFLKIFLGTVACVSIAAAIGMGGIIMWMRWGYYDELNESKTGLNKIRCVQVAKIWGHDDLTLEEISVRILAKDKGEIVLNDLNKNDNDNPANVYVTACAGYSFRLFPRRKSSCFSGRKRPAIRIRFSICSG
jgi:hypothetical protein